MLRKALSVLSSLPQEPEKEKDEVVLRRAADQAGGARSAAALLQEAGKKMRRVLPSPIDLVTVCQRFSGSARAGILEFLNKKGRKVPLLSGGGRFKGWTLHSPRLKRAVCGGVLDASEEPALYMVDGIPVLVRQDGWGSDDRGVVLHFPRGLFSLSYFPQAALDHFPHSRSPGGRFLVTDVGSAWEHSVSGPEPQGRSYMYSIPKAPTPDMMSDGEASTRLLYERGVCEEDMKTPDPCERVSELVLTPSAQKAVDFVRGWYRARAEYEQRRIIWRCGLLFEGPPGTGKTALARALAYEMGVPIYVYHLTSLSSRGFEAAWRTMCENTPCVALLDDFDRVFVKDRRVTSEGPSFNVLLQALGGVSEVNGLTTIVAVNDVSKVDPTIFDESSICPYGRRVSVRATFALPTAEQRAQIAGRLLHDLDEPARAALVAAGDGDSGKQFVERCSATVVDKLHRDLGMQRLCLS